MGMLLAVGLIWIISEWVHKKASAKNASIFKALEQIDLPSILFFVGILLAVSALQSFGILNELANVLTDRIQNQNLIVFVIGILSSIFDNVPLVAAVQGMFSLEQYPTGHFFWEFLAYCAGTGGSILIIGSAAGVAAMGIEKISFFWYLLNISLYALIGYAVGASVAVLMSSI